MPTIRLTPSSYGRSSTSRVTVTNPENMYYNTDHTAAYCSIRGRNSTSSTYYAFINGFNFDDVPANAIVSSFVVKIRCYRNTYQQTGSTYRLRLASSASNNSVISGTTMSGDIGTTADVYTIPTGDLTWSQLKNYGSGFSIEIPLRPSSSQYPYVYVYGAEIEVTYTLPVYHNITVSGAEPSGTTSVLEGSSFTARGGGYSSKPTVTDNGVDVTSQVQAVSTDSVAACPSSNTNSNFTVTNADRAYHGADNTTYATLDLAGGGATGGIYFNFGAISLPTGATLQSVACSVTLQFSRNNSSSGVTSSFQLYANTTAKGSANNWVTGATDVAKTTYNLSVGSWTASDLSNPRLYITMTNNASSTHRYIYVYGATLTVTYSVAGYIYVYTVSNITAAHTIVFTASPGGDPPVITVGTPSRTIISDESGYDQCVCTFRSDMALQAWEARATKSGVTPARGVGLLVESGTTLAANTDATIYVENEELTNGDGEYTITVYGQSTGGVWSG